MAVDRKKLARPAPTMPLVLSLSAKTRCKSESESESKGKCACASESANERHQSCMTWVGSLSEGSGRPTDCGGRSFE